MPSDKLYDHDAVLEDAQLGSEPSEEYLEHVEMLDNIVRECMHVSNGYGHIRSLTSQHFYASVLFTTLVTRGVSLANLIPHTPWATKLIEHWDYASVAVIVRTMLEIRLAFHYLCIDPCPRIEWECRWNILNLHDCMARRKLFEAQGAEPSEIAGFDEQAEELRQRLLSNTYFQALAPGQQRKFLNGQTPYLFALEEIGERAGIEKPQFRWLYVLLSSHVHGLPMSFYRIGGAAGDDRGRGLPSPVEEGYTSLCISLATSLLTSTRDEVHSLFAEYKKPDEKQPSVEEQFEKATEDVEALPVGKSRDLVQSELIRIEVTRTSGSSVNVTYYYVPTNEVVLRRTDSEEIGTLLDWYDHTFWNVSVDGGPGTESMVDGINTKRTAFKVNADTRTISFKIKK